jgi:hypothetical protein
MLDNTPTPVGGMAVNRIRHLPHAHSIVELVGFRSGLLHGSLKGIQNIELLYIYKNKFKLSYFTIPPEGYKGRAG